MGKPNWTNKTVFVGDNLHVMRGMNSESADLIYLDHADNLQLLCSNCNRRKGIRSHADLMAELAKKPSVELI